MGKSLIMKLGPGCVWALYLFSCLVYCLHGAISTQSKCVFCNMCSYEQWPLQSNPLRLSMKSLNQNMNPDSVWPSNKTTEK